MMSDDSERRTDGELCPQDVLLAVQSPPYSLEPLRKWLTSARPVEVNLLPPGTPTPLIKNFRGVGLLHYVLMHSPGDDKSDVIKLLIARGADVHQIAKSPWNFGTHLHSRVSVGEAKTLLDHGADIDGVTERGVTPLMMFAGLNEISMVKFLVRRGADITLKAPVFGDFSPATPRVAAEHVRHGRRSEAHDFLVAVGAAGGWRPYARAPRIELVRLRSLCSRGHATPPPALRRLFGAPAPPSNKVARVVSPLPDEIFWLVLSFWRTSRDDRAEA